MQVLFGGAMVLEPKYKIGDKVIFVYVSWACAELPCPDCLGEKEWTVECPSGEVFQTQCNTCSAGYYSKGTVTEYADRIIKQHLTIGSIQTDTANKECPISYMCAETGVGNGSVYEEQKLFSTMADADIYGQQELERTNGMRQKKELEKRLRQKEETIYKLD